MDSAVIQTQFPQFTPVTHCVILGIYGMRITEVQTPLRYSGLVEVMQWP